MRSKYLSETKIVEKLVIRRDKCLEYLLEIIIGEKFQLKVQIIVQKVQAPPISELLTHYDLK